MRRNIVERMVDLQMKGYYRIPHFILSVFGLEIPPEVQFSGGIFCAQSTWDCFASKDQNRSKSTNISECNYRQIQTMGWSTKRRRMYC